MRRLPHIPHKKAERGCPEALQAPQLNHTVPAIIQSLKTPASLWMQAQVQRAGSFKQRCSASLTTMFSALAACGWPTGRMAAQTARRDAGSAGSVGRSTTSRSEKPGNNPGGRSKKPGSNPGGQQVHPGRLSHARGDEDLTEYQETCDQHVQEHISETLRQPWGGRVLRSSFP